MKTQNMKTKMIIKIGMMAIASFIITCGGTGGDKKNSQPFLALLGAAPESISAPVLGSAASFAVFGGGAGITNAGTKTAISGDMGTTGASTMITGFHNLTCGYTETPLNSGYVSGINYTNVPPAFGVLCKEGTVETFAMATSVAGDALTAFNDLASRPDGTDPGAGQLGGLTVYPGVYKSASGAFLISGSDLTLDAQGNANAIWIFQMASSLTVGTATESRSVILTNGAQAKNVYWQVGSAATINGAGGGTMVGTIIASAGMTFSTAGNQTITTLNGRALGLFAAVTMVNTVINVDGIQAVIPPPPVAVPPVSPVTITGSTAANVVAAPGAGYINVENNGGLVTVTEVGTGTINIVNNGGVLTATNTGNGTVTINSNATGVVTVTNTGNGRVTVNATGAAAVTFTHTGDDDISYP